MPKGAPIKTTKKQSAERARINREKRARGEKVFDAAGHDITAGHVARGGHPTDMLDRHLIAAIAKVTSEGSFPHHAAMSLGVKEGTFREWMDKGKKGEGDPLYAELFTAVDSARAGAIAAASARIQAAGKKGIWQADARMLESMDSPAWMRTEKRVNEGGEAFKGILEELREARIKAVPSAEAATPAKEIETTIPVGAPLPPLPLN